MGISLHPENMVDLRTRSEEERREIARKGGIASGISKKRTKAVREALRQVLDEPAGAGNLTKLEYLAARAIVNIGKEDYLITPKDLKIIADILGETTINIQPPDGAFGVFVRTDKDASDIADAVEMQNND